jgi:hypothetical protein
MHLIYLFGIFEMLFSSQLGVPCPVSCCVMRHTLAVSASTCFIGLAGPSKEEEKEQDLHFQILSFSSWGAIR